MSSLRDQLRAALIVAYLATITVAAVPAPNGMLTPAMKKRPETLEAIAPWVKLVVAVGLADDEQGGRDWIFRAGARLTRTRNTVLGPSKWLLRVTGTSQSWRMFGGAPIRHGRFEVHGRVQGSSEWIPVFIESSDQYQWNALVLNQSRARALRSNFADHGLKPGYTRFAHWVADQAFRELPELISVRVREQGIRIPPPDVLREKGLILTKPYWPLQFDREDFR